MSRRRVLYKRTKEEIFCYWEKNFEIIMDKIDELVANFSEKTVFVYQVGTNNVVKHRSKEVYEKYKVMIRKIRDSRRRSVVCGLIPRYDIGPFVLSKMLGINTRLKKLCMRQDVMYIDVWDHFSNDRSLFSGVGLHLNRVGKERLGRALDEGVKYQLKRNKVQ